MLVGLVMDVNLLRIARLLKGSCTKFRYMIHGTKHSTKYGTMYGTGYRVQGTRYNVCTRNIRMHSTRYKMQ